MFVCGDFIHFELNELKYIASIVSCFDKSVSKRIDDIYSYHKFTLKENENQLLMIHVNQCIDYRKVFHYKKPMQLEFDFFESDEICVHDQN